MRSIDAAKAVADLEVIVRKHCDEHLALQVEPFFREHGWSRVGDHVKTFIQPSSVPGDTTQKQCFVCVHGSLTCCKLTALVTAETMWRRRVEAIGRPRRPGDGKVTDNVEQVDSQTTRRDTTLRYAAPNRRPLK